MVYVSWDDAQAYCRWLSQVTGKTIRLPSEAARGDKDRRAYPWGDAFEATRCNTAELDWRDTTPVGVFQNGASPYGCLDMVGNVWEWCEGWYDKTKHYRALRGGPFVDSGAFARCASRLRSGRLSRSSGFRAALAVSP